MSDAFPTDPLSRLLAQAMQEARKRKVNPSPKDTPPASFRETYTNPKNWRRNRGVALIHKSSEGRLTLLGNFREYIHIRKKGVRKLLREEAPIEVDGQEVVTGDWWLVQEVKHRIAPSELVEDVEMVLDVHLRYPQVYCQSVRLLVRLLNNAFFRVELLDQTRFVDPENRTFLFFPAGLDILEGMTYEAKLELRKHLEARHA